MREQQHVLQGATQRDETFGKRDCGVIVLEAGDRQGEKGRTRRLGACIVTLLHGGVGVAFDQGLHERFAQAPSRGIGHVDEAPGPDQALVGRLRGHAEEIMHLLIMHLLRRGPGIAQAFGRGLLALGDEFAKQLGIVDLFGKSHGSFGLWFREGWLGMNG